jgi:hypothetical protein
MAWRRLSSRFMSEHSQRHSSKGSPPQPISHNTVAVPWVSTLALLVTIPAFYLEMVAPATWPLAAVLYFAAAAVIAGLQWPLACLPQPPCPLAARRPQRWPCGWL